MTEIHIARQHIHDWPHDHEHEDNRAWWSALARALHLPGYGHTHDLPAASDVLYADALGLRTVKVAFVLLGLTTLIQIVIYLSSGSVALLADTLHNLGDALNSLPLWIAFVVMRRTANRRYTYGYGRAEDVAGLFIVASIVFSAVYIIWESVNKLLNPQPLTNLGWVVAAALVGFVGNEAVALLQLRVGQQIGSAAMVADGRHAQTDGLTSLGVLVAVIGARLGIPILDPLIGILMGFVIVFIARDAIIAMWQRLMDAVDPSLIDQAEQVLVSHPEIQRVVLLQMRWIGHRLHADITMALEEGLTLYDSEAITDHIRHHLFHEFPNLGDALIAVVPWQETRPLYSEETQHHGPGQRG